MNPPHSGHPSSGLFCSLIPTFALFFSLSHCYVFFRSPPLFWLPPPMFPLRLGLSGCGFEYQTGYLPHVFSLSEKIMEAKVTNDTDLLFAFPRGIPACECNSRVVLIPLQYIYIYNAAIFMANDLIKSILPPHNEN